MLKWKWVFSKYNKGKYEVNIIVKYRMATKNLITTSYILVKSLIWHTNFINEVIWLG